MLVHPHKNVNIYIYIYEDSLKLLIQEFISESHMCIYSIHMTFLKLCHVIFRKLLEAKKEKKKFKGITNFTNFYFFLIDL